MRRPIPFVAGVSRAVRHDSDVAEAWCVGLDHGIEDAAVSEGRIHLAAEVGTGIREPATQQAPLAAAVAAHEEADR